MGSRQEIGGIVGETFGGCLGLSGGSGGQKETAG